MKEVYLENALEWIRQNEPGNFWFATVLKDEIGMSLEDVNDYLTAFGVDSEDREEIMNALSKEEQ